jgi:hypothetical protein
VKCALCGVNFKCLDVVTEYWKLVSHLECVRKYTDCEIYVRDSFPYCTFVLAGRHGGLFHGLVPDPKKVFDYRRLLVVNKWTKNFGGHCVEWDVSKPRRCHMPDDKMSGGKGSKAVRVGGRCDGCERCEYYDKSVGLPEHGEEFASKWRAKVDDFCRQVRRRLPLDD